MYSSKTVQPTLLASRFTDRTLAARCRDILTRNCPNARFELMWLGQEIPTARDRAGKPSLPRSR